MQVHKLTEEELSEITSIQQRFSQVVFDMGEIELQLIDLSDKTDTLINEKTSLKFDYRSLKESDKTLTDKLFEKYGHGSINVQEGTITTE